jgi:hypothetical protein
MMQSANNKHLEVVAGACHAAIVMSLHLLDSDYKPHHGQYHASNNFCLSWRQFMPASLIPSAAWECMSQQRPPL